MLLTPPPPPPTLSTFVNAIGLRYPRPWIKFFSVKTHFKNRLGVRGHFCGLFLPALDEPTRVCANCFMMHTLHWLVVRELHCVVHPCINRKVCPPEQQGSWLYPRPRHTLPVPRIHEHLTPTPVFAIGTNVEAVCYSRDHPGLWNFPYCPFPCFAVLRQNCS